ncbi:hypothetical protein [Microbulbifer sp. YPW1]|uniref:hypothetical protein n=1 Tax=Microbulbifer sp. YPW1 TaxID=2745199 RepID=UPI001599AE64|nr:hypothetical protein [Microbulbifer sp. YPW1]QKX18630.1 hypothetical protein HUW35_17570 [Microbulbifer sp. YPW1]
MRKITQAQTLSTSLLLSAAAIATLACAPLASADSLQAQLQQCSQFSDDNKRLACYDKLTGSLQKHAEQQFGQEQKQAVEEAPESITATITKAEEGAYGKFIFTLDNGQVWRQTDTKRSILRDGDQVTVERGALGSFRMRKTTGGRTMRVKRVN